MKRKIEKNSDEWKFFGEFYRMVENFHDPEDNDAYWDELCKEAIRLGETYKGIAPKLVVAFINYQQELFESQKKEAEKAEMDKVEYNQMQLNKVG